MYLELAKKRLVISTEAGPFRPAESAVALRVFVDRSIVEAFADDRQAVVRRVYPSRPNSLGVLLFTSGGPAKVRRAVAWKMFPSNPY